MSDTGSTKDDDEANRGEAVRTMTQLLTGNGMPADLAAGAAADLVDMAIKQRAASGAAE